MLPLFNYFLWQSSTWRGEQTLYLRVFGCVASTSRLFLRALSNYLNGACQRGGSSFKVHRGTTLAMQHLVTSYITCACELENVTYYLHF